ncbi:MAG: hypothetical protein Q9221_008298 [Calogaya cf. arnoldii]
MIYQYCLVVHGEIVPYPTEYEYPRYKMPDGHMTEQQRNYMHRKPDVALLQVSKQIREETCPILYGCNLWRKSGTYSQLCTFAKFRQVNRHFKHIITSLDSRDLDSGVENTLCGRDWKFPARLMIRGILHEEEARSIQRRFQEGKNKLEDLIEEDNGSFMLIDDGANLSAWARRVQEDYELGSDDWGSDDWGSDDSDRPGAFSDLCTGTTFHRKTVYEESRTRKTGERMAQLKA